MIIRRRQPSDDGEIGALNDASFGGPDEARLVGDLRTAGVDAIELVATDGEAIVGHILFSVLSLVVEQRAVRALELAGAPAQWHWRHPGCVLYPAAFRR